MNAEGELDEKRHDGRYGDIRWSDVVSLVVAAREALETFSLPYEESLELDCAVEKFSTVVPYFEDGQCESSLT